MRVFKIKKSDKREYYGFNIKTADKSVAFCPNLH